MFSRTVFLFLDFRKFFPRVIYPDSRKKNCSSLQIYEKTQNQRQQTKTKSDKTRLKPSFYRFCTTDMSNICFIYRFSLLLFTIQESAFYFVCSVVIWYVFDCRNVFCYIEVCLFSSCYRAMCFAQSHCVSRVYRCCIQGFLRCKTIIYARKGHYHLHIATWRTSRIEIRCHSYR